MHRPVKLFCLAALASVLPLSTSAAPILIIADAGSVRSVESGSPEAAAGFVVGEAVKFTFSFDQATPDTNAAAGAALYTDPNATLTLTGQSSGASVDYANGLSITLANDTQIEFGSISNPANAVDTRVVANDIDYINAAGTFFTDVDDLPQVFVDLLANPFPQPQGFQSGTSFWNGTSASQGLSLSPPPSPSVFLLGTPIGLIGDFDNSGRVEQGDLNLVLNTWGQTRTFEDGLTSFATANVDQEELNLVLNNWGQSGLDEISVSSTVPEPLTMMGFGLLAACFMRGR